MKQIKQQFLLTVALLLCSIGIANAEVLSGSCGDNVTYKLDTQTGKLEINGMGAMRSYIDAPWYSYCESIKEVTISDGVTSIGESAFQGCSGLTSVTIPNSVTSIGEGAFSGCYYIDEVKLYCKDNGDFANYLVRKDIAIFYQYYLGNRPHKLLIGEEELTKIDIPKSVTQIGDYACYNCPNIVQVNIHANVTSIGAYAFGGDYSMPYIYLASNTPPYVNSSTCNQWVMWVVPNEAVLNSYIASDDWNALYKNHQLIYKSDYHDWTAEVEAEPTLSAIHMNIGEAYLNKVVNLKVVGTINSYDLAIMKSKMTVLRSLDLSDASIVANKYEYDDGYCSKTDELDKECMNPNLQTLVLPKTLKIIGDNAFCNLTKLTDVTCESEDVTLKENTFQGCNALANVTFSNMTINGNNTFANCTSLKKITLPSGVITRLPYKTFSGCSNLEYVDMSKMSMTYLSKKDYSYNSWEAAYTFENCRILKTVILPNDAKEVYSRMFYNCTALEEINIPASVMSIRDFAFGTENDYNYYYGCNNLKQVTFAPNSKLEEIDNSAFAYCSSLQDFTFPAGLKTIGDYAFKGCTSLKNVVLSPGITMVGAHMFEGCTALSSVSMPSSVQEIKDYAFYNCTALKEFKVPAGVEKIGAYAFNGCKNLEDVYSYTIKPTVIDYNTFSCWNIATLHVPAQGYYYYFYDANWKYFLTLSTFLEPYDYFYAKEDITIQKSTGAFEGDPNVEIYEEGGVIVKDNVDQTFSDVHLRLDGMKGGSLIGHEGLKLKKGCRLYQDIVVLANKWYYFCFPFTVQLSEIKKDGNYIFRTYDTKQRGSGQSGWVNLDINATVLNQGQGYIFQTDKAGLLSIPVSEPNFTTLEVQKSLYDFASGAAPEDAGWNFIGNPYTSYFNLDKMQYNYPITYWDSEANTYVSIRQGDDDYTFHPYMAFFVQKPDHMSYVGFDPDGRTTYQQSKAAEQASSAKGFGANFANAATTRRVVNLTLSDGNAEDKTRVVFNTEKTNNYEKECDAAKFISTEASQIYTLDGKKTQYSINERTPGDVPVGIIAKKKGTYTIAAIRMDCDVLLKDNETNAVVNLAKGAYQFEAEAGTDDSRFTLIFADDTATWIKGVEFDAEQRNNGLGLINVKTAEFFNLAGQSSSADSQGLKIIKSGKNVVKVFTK